MIQYQVRKHQASKGLCLQFNNIPSKQCNILQQEEIYEAEVVDIWGVHRTSG